MTVSGLATQTYTKSVGWLAKTTLRALQSILMKQPMTVRSAGYTDTGLAKRASETGPASSTNDTTDYATQEVAMKPNVGIFRV